MARLTAIGVERSGERLLARGDRSLYWPRHETLIVADLHIGKTQSLRGRGAAVPDGVLDDDLTRLSSALSETGARHLLVLGDLVHDAEGLTAGVRDDVARWRERTDVSVTVIQGNHDRRARGFPAAWRLAVHELPLVVAPFTFSHEPISAAGYNWCGHLHPVVTLRAAGDRLRLPCFHLGTRVGVLPAFSALTGGAEVRGAVGERVVAIADGYVIELPAPV